MGKWRWKLKMISLVRSSWWFHYPSNKIKASLQLTLWTHFFYISDGSKRVGTPLLFVLACGSAVAREGCWFVWRRQALPQSVPKDNCGQDYVKSSSTKITKCRWRWGVSPSDDLTSNIWRWGAPSIAKRCSGRLYPPGATPWRNGTEGRSVFSENGKNASSNNLDDDVRGHRLWPHARHSDFQLCWTTKSRWQPKRQILLAETTPWNLDA